MRALILACLLLGCGTGTEIDGTAEGCPETEIDLTVPQVLTFCAESGSVIVIDTEREQCTSLSGETGCKKLSCANGPDGFTVGPVPVLIDCAGYHVANMVHPLCTPPPETLEACQWLTE